MNSFFVSNQYRGKKNDGPLKGGIKPVLTKELLRVRVGKRRVSPRYIDTESPALQELAENLIEVFYQSLGERRDEIEEKLRIYHEGALDFLLARGLMKLLMDRCDFASPEEVDPQALRHQLFEEAARRRKEGTFHRGEILSKVVAELNLKEEILLENLYSDLKGHQRLIKFKGTTPVKLLERYNTAQAQGVLLQALSLEVEVEGSPPEYRQLFRYMKFFRLLYTLHPLPSGRYKIVLDGPLTLFQSSTKYGLQMANFMLALLKMPYFSLKAEVVWGKVKKKKEFELDSSSGLKSSLPDPNHWMPEEFQTFVERFEKLDSPWTIQENPDILNLGPKEVLIPDYKFFRRDTGQKAYLEIFGYWKPRGVVKYLNHLKDHNLVLALSEKLLTDSENQMKVNLAGEKNIYIYKRVLLPREILERLEQLEP